MTRQVHHNFIKSVTFTPDGEPVSASRKVHARTARTAAEIAQLDDESVRLRYRQMAHRLNAAKRGSDDDVVLCAAFQAEATKRGLI